MGDRNDAPITVRMSDVSVAYRVRSASGRRGPGALVNAFRPSARLEALSAVSLTLRAGDVVGLVGSNGAGKSTLLRTMAGLLPVTQGSIEASGKPLLLSVGAALLPELTGRRNAYLGCLAQGLPEEEAREKAEQAIAFADLGSAIDRQLMTYSSGMAARLRFAITTVQTQEILLVDEALSVGDSSFAAKATRRMRELSDNAGTVVLVSHSAHALLESCNRGVWLDQGTVRHDGPIREVLSAYQAGL